MISYDKQTLMVHHLSSGICKQLLSSLDHGIDFLSRLGTVARNVRVDGQQCRIHPKWLIYTQQKERC